MKRGAPAGAPGAAPSGRRSGARAVAACQAGPVLPAARAPRGAPPDAPLVTAAAALGCLAGPPRAPPSPGGGNRGRGAPYASPRLNFSPSCGSHPPGARTPVRPTQGRPASRAFPFQRSRAPGLRRERRRRRRAGPGAHKGAGVSEGPRAPFPRLLRGWS